MDRPCLGPMSRWLRAAMDCHHDRSCRSCRAPRPSTSTALARWPNTSSRLGEASQCLVSVNTLSRLPKRQGTSGGVLILVVGKRQRSRARQCRREGPARLPHPRVRLATRRATRVRPTRVRSATTRQVACQPPPQTPRPRIAVLNVNRLHGSPSPPTPPRGHPLLKVEQIPVLALRDGFDATSRHGHFRV
jgi:hypothetical protein